jgi:hypothetical protein
VLDYYRNDAGMDRGSTSRRLVVWFVCILLSVGAGSAALHGQEGGDANNDGFIDSLDVPLIVDEILGLATAPGNPDCVVDGFTDVLDLVCVHNHIVEFPPMAIDIAETEVWTCATAVGGIRRIRNVFQVAAANAFAPSPTQLLTSP